MKKIYLPVCAVAATFAVSSVASAAPTVYGKLHVSVGSIATDDGAGNEPSANAVSTHSSRLGFKGEIAGDGGVSFPYQIEYQVDPTENEHGALKERDQFVGMKGGFGEISIGIMSTPYKEATSKVDVLSDSYIDYNNIIAKNQDLRIGDAIRYQNNFGGVKVAILHSLKGDSLAEENDATVTSASASLGFDGGWASVAYQATKDDDSAIKLGGGYNVAGFSLGLAYEMITGEEDKGNVDQTNFVLSAKYGLSDSTNLIAQFGTASMDDDSDDGTMMGLGITQAYGDSATVYLIYGSGADGGLTAKVGGGDATAIAAGIIGKF